VTRDSQGEHLLYTELAPWYHVMTAPEEYARESEYIIRLIEAAIVGEARTLLELGSGGGNNASHLKARFTCVLSDLSPQMLATSREINPECEHIGGDMRTLRLGRTFDAVLIHDAIDYMTTEDDLRAAITTAAAHLRPGGVAVLAPDVVIETFEAGTSTGGTDADDGRGVRYIEWTHDVGPDATRYQTDYVYLLRDPDGSVRVRHDRHNFGLFARATWARLMDDAGLTPMDDLPVEDPYAGHHVVLVARRR